MHVTIIGAYLTYLAVNAFKHFYPSYPISQEMSLITIVIGGVSFYLARKLFLNVVLQTCSCYCGPGKCECTCGCREKCECYYRNKEEYFDKRRRRGANDFC